MRIRWIHSRGPQTFFLMSLTLISLPNFCATSNFFQDENLEKWVQRRQSIPLTAFGPTFLPFRINYLLPTPIWAQVQDSGFPCYGAQNFYLPGLSLLYSPVRQEFYPHLTAKETDWQIKWSRPFSEVPNCPGCLLCAFLSQNLHGQGSKGE